MIESGVNCFRVNLSHGTQNEKKSYFELRNDVVKFVFPEPGLLEGVKSMSKTLLKMTNVTFQYPTRDTPTISVSYTHLTLPTIE